MWCTLFVHHWRFWMSLGSFRKLCDVISESWKVMNELWKVSNVFLESCEWVVTSLDWVLETSNGWQVVLSKSEGFLSEFWEVLVCCGRSWAWNVLSVFWEGLRCCLKFESDLWEALSKLWCILSVWWVLSSELWEASMGYRTTWVQQMESGQALGSVKNVIRSLSESWEVLNEFGKSWRVVGSHEWVLESHEWVMGSFTWVLSELWKALKKSWEVHMGCE